jgi:aminoglycoside phosphotransferase (APT) family kinase protein
MTDLDHPLSPAVTDWLRGVLPDAEPPLACERISGGYSMLTYRLTDRRGRCWVLRRPPAGHRAGRAHDTAREARVMTALAGTGVPVPAVVAVGVESDPLGVPCHITDFVDGYVLADAESAQRHLDRGAIRTACEQIVTGLARLHRIDPDAVGLGEFGPRRDYLARQLRRWRAVVADAAAGDTAAAAAELTVLADLLERTAPADTAIRIVHGDYRLGNAIVDSAGGLRAVLDWELASLGDPLADLATLVAFWDPPADAMLGVRMPTLAPGAIGVEEVIARYRDRTDADLSGFWYYRTFAAWRLACTALRARARYASGAMRDDSADLTRFATAADSWISAAEHAVAQR